ncbi:MAG: TIGR02757 family protein [Deltaproteobacteria bacterium]|nr:TIGR02757 family protein [Deltaproteobacteria bacterium]
MRNTAIKKQKTGFTPHPELKRRLDGLYKTYGSEYLASDPLYFPRLFKADKDREIAGLIAASLAYGRVAQIKKSISSVLDIMDNEPYAFTMAFDPKRGQKLFSGFKHRFNDSRDISCLIYYAKQMIKNSGSIGGFFKEGVLSKNEDMKASLSSFVKYTLTLDSEPIYGRKKLPEKAGVRFFFPSPEDGSPCKRLNLYLRWMIRKDDGLDFGIWKFIEPSKLIMPLDTHVARISRLLGLSKAPAASWRMAEEVTAALRTLDPRDPVKYDFSICRLGILSECPSKRDVKKCGLCGIKDVCIVK